MYCGSVMNIRTIPRQLRRHMVELQVRFVFIHIRKDSSPLGVLDWDKVSVRLLGCKVERHFRDPLGHCFFSGDLWQHETNGPSNATLVKYPGNVKFALLVLESVLPKKRDKLCALRTSLYRRTVRSDTYPYKPFAEFSPKLKGYIKTKAREHCYSRNE